MSTDERAEVETQIPRLSEFAYEVTSPKTRRYNCFAWAAGDAEHVWSPTSLGSGVYWPPGIPALPSVSGVLAAFAAVGYEECATADLEAGYDKVAIFVDSLGEPRHAARQLDSGAWTSKLGDHVDIEHADVAAVGGLLYGEPVRFLRRPR